MCACAAVAAPSYDPESGTVAHPGGANENELDVEAVRRGYATTATVPSESDPCLLVGRLDAALMLALVFLSEAPDPTRGPAAADHARDLALGVAARQP